MMSQPCASLAGRWQCVSGMGCMLVGSQRAGSRAHPGHRFTKGRYSVQQQDGRRRRPDEVVAVCLRERAETDLAKVLEVLEVPEVLAQVPHSSVRARLAFWLAARPFNNGKNFGSICWNLASFPPLARRAFSPSTCTWSCPRPPSVIWPPWSRRHVGSPFGDNVQPEATPAASQERVQRAGRRCRELLASSLSPRWLRPEQRLPSLF